MEFLSFLEKDANKQLEESLAIMTKINSEMGKIGEKRKGISTPSGSDSANKQLIADYQKMEATIVKMQLAIDKLSVSKQNNNKKTQEEITNGRILAQNSDRQVKATSQLAGAYRNLSAQVAIASERYQNIIARGKTAEQTQKQFNRELRTAQLEFQKLQSRVLQADSAVGKWNRTNERTIGLGRDLVGAFGVATGVSLFAVIARDIFLVTKESQALEKSLKLVTDTGSNFVEQQMFLIDIAGRYGLEIQGLTKQYTQFYISAKDKISGTKIQQIFESISKAGASMGLSVEQQQRAFLALNQMMSKGTIQAEELRGQLGEALPGAFGIMAKAMGVTEKQLGKMMKDGEVLASEVLPKFARQLEITYGIENVNRIDNIVSAQNRLSNAWTDFVKSLDEDGNKLSKILTVVINQLSEAVKAYRWLLTSAETERKNNLDKIRVDGKKFIEEYYATQKKYSQQNLLDKKAELIAEDESTQRRIDNLRKINEQINKKGIRSPFGQLTKEDTSQLLKNNSTIKKYNESLSYTRGEIEGLNGLLQEKTRVQIKDTEEVKKATKAERERTESVKAGSLEMSGAVTGFLYKLEEQKRLFKEAQEITSSTSEEYKKFQNVIDGLQESIDLIRDPSKVLTADVSGLERQNEMYVKNREALLKLQEATDKWLETFRTDFFQQMGLSSLDQFFDGTFDKLIAGAENAEEKFRVSFLAISEVAQEAFNLINQADEARSQAQLERIQRDYDIAWEFSDKSDVAKRKLDAERERREKEIAQKEFKRKQNMAVVNIGIDTAQAIMATYGQAGWIGGTAGAIFLGAMGLAQIALVKSQKMPEYYTGTENAKEGFALTQERGREIIKDKHGKIKSLGSDKGAQVTWLDSGDKVLNNQRTMQELMFDKDLNNILANNNIAMPKIEMHAPKIDFSPVVDAINNQPIIIPDFDKLKTRIKRGNTIQTIEKAHTNFSSVKI